MPIDPLDQQLVEAVLSRPRRAKADLEEAKLAGLRPSRAALDEVDEEEEEEEVEPPSRRPPSHARRDPDEADIELPSRPSRSRAPVGRT